MCGFLGIVILNYYLLISGMTELPEQIKEKLVIEIFLGCWMQKYVLNYLASVGMGAKGEVT